MGIEGATIYRSPSEIAGTQPYFVLPQSTDIAWWDQRGGAPEAPLIAWATQLVRPKDLFLDIGTHIGTWGIVFRLFGAKVIGFEAQGWLAELCRIGYRLNGLTPKIFNTALGAETGTALLTARHIDGGGGSIVCRFDSPAITEQVSVRPLDDFELNPVLMKIDVEGAELDVLRGAHKTISQHQPKIIFECWNDERGQRIEDLFRHCHDELHYRTLPVWSETWLAEPDQG